MSVANVYNFEFSNIDITKPAINLSQYKNKVILVVNTASKCGFTYQYEGLEELYSKYKDKGFIVIGIPSDSFKQEYSKNEEIASFCQRFKITFPLTSEYQVRGEEAHPFFKYLKEKHDTTPKWNFYKFLINKNGDFVESYSSMTKPNSKKLSSKIEELLNK